MLVTFGTVKPFAKSTRKSILDTDMLSEVLSGVDASVAAHAIEYVREHRVFTFTSITLYEITTGLVRIQALAKLKKVEELFRANDEVVPAHDDYRLAGDILGNLRRAGREIGYSDPLIAACAIRRSLPLVTGNVKHFEFIRDVGFELELENWRQS